ncbi:MAG: polysaccharide deacetylase family protein [Candidatus Omnitrophota bacterium]|nr:MAG: polysaccharide deacetylase family protein [Candidatus Omnitrophota bacterium]
MPRRKKGIVTLAFDDAYLDTYKHAIKYLDKLNIKSTIAVPASFIGKRFENRRLAGLEELKDNLKRGHEIASHTLTHPNLSRLSLKDKNEMISEIVESKKELEGLLHNKVNSFVFPYINKNQLGRGGLNLPYLLKARPYYKSARFTADSPYFNKIPVKNPYSIIGFAIMKKHSLSYLKKQVDYAEKKKCWLIMVFHLVGEKNTESFHRPKPYRFFMHIDVFRELIDYILSKDIMLLTQKDAVKNSS